ncbi:MAG TPA: recombination mediator RecR [Treponemataceae bacterium]|nr:recombination mediator RecR [Treponemataceae bacterium]
MNALDDVIESLSRLPGIGKKSASRLAYHLLKCDQTYCERLAADILVLHERIKPCSICGSYSEGDLCPVCSDPGRDKGVLCVVEQPQDVQTIEAVREFTGLFHVLGGVIAPLEGIGPDQLRLSSLVARVKEGGIREVILATNPTIEGDTTALYIQRILKDTGVTITRLASGLPVGGDLEYADRLTLSRSFRGRSSF